MYPSGVKYMVAWLTIAILITGCRQEKQFGEAITVSAVTPISDVLEAQEALLGQKVVIEGQVTGVCPKKGCWMTLFDASKSKSIHVQVEDDVIVFPSAAKGKRAKVEGFVEKLELTHAEAISWNKHRAEELGQDFDEKSVTGPETHYQIRALGAMISDL